VPKKLDMPSDVKAALILDAIEDRKAVDPVMIDLRGKTLITDFFIVCSGTSNVHIRSIAEFVLEKTEEERLASPKIEGKDAAEWVLIDFGDVVLHVMAEETRDRYKLEQFWTTPQPKGALPPTPDSIGEFKEPLEELNLGAFDDDDDFDDEDAAFFDEADQEVEPIEEDDEPASESTPDTSPSTKRNGQGA
jgi:ribosome-associated protein